MSEILNEDNFDRAIDNISKSWTMQERTFVNNTGMGAFYPVLKTKVDAHKAPTRKPVGYPEHMADTLVKNVKKDGSIEVGFSKKGKKAYIARFINDGWQSHNQYGGPYKYIPGEHYWESTEEETHDAVIKAMTQAAKAVMDKRVGL